jgi:hypothetical protein
MIRSRRMRWAGHVAHIENRTAYRILVRKREENLSLDVWIILKLLL